MDTWNSAVLSSQSLHNIMIPKCLSFLMNSFLLSYSFTPFPSTFSLIHRENYSRVLGAKVLCLRTASILLIYWSKINIEYYHEALELLCSLTKCFAVSFVRTTFSHNFHTCLYSHFADGAQTSCLDFVSWSTDTLAPFWY